MMYELGQLPFVRASVKPMVMLATAEQLSVAVAEPSAAGVCVSVQLIVTLFGQTTVGGVMSRTVIV